MILEGGFSEFEKGNDSYSKKPFNKSLHELIDRMNANHDTSSKTFGGVVCIGVDLYVRFGASELEIKYGYEQHAANADNIHIQAKAMHSLIIYLVDNIKEKHT